MHCIPARLHTSDSRISIIERAYLKSNVHARQKVIFHPAVIAPEIAYASPSRLSNA
jgi:hypothetical protein